MNQFKALGYSFILREPRSAGHNILQSAINVYHEREKAQIRQKVEAEAGIPHYSIADLYGIQVISSPEAVKHVQYRFPRSKKRRIRKKWAKQEKNYQYEPMSYLVNSGYGRPQLICHPSVYNKISTEIDKQNQVK